MGQHEYNMLLHYISLNIHYQLSYVEHVSKLKKINSVYNPFFVAVVLSIQSSIFRYRYHYMHIHIYIYILVYISRKMWYTLSLILPNNSMHQHFIDLDDNHCQFSYLKYIIKLLINKFDYLFILLLLSTFVISRHSFTVL